MSGFPPKFVKGSSSNRPATCLNSGLQPTALRQISNFFMADRPEAVGERVKLKNLSQHLFEFRSWSWCKLGRIVTRDYTQTGLTFGLDQDPSHS